MLTNILILLPTILILGIAVPCLRPIGRKPRRPLLRPIAAEGIHRSATPARSFRKTRATLGRLGDLREAYPGVALRQPPSRLVEFVDQRLPTDVLAGDTSKPICLSAPPTARASLIAFCNCS